MVVTYRALEKLTDHPQQRCWVPFTCTAVIFILAFTGLAYSFYPYVIPDQLTAWDAASDAGSLWIIFLGTVVVLPAIIGYTVLSYYIFRGKASALVYH
jgi:cytochrome d ubiquinol oxidase subunit II